MIELFGRRVSTLQSWESWSRNPDIEATRYQFVAGALADGSVNLEKVMNDLKAYLAKPRAIARIVGLSGLGKTRVALETFRPPKTQDATGTAETASVIYTNADDPGSLVSLLHDLRADKSDGILIVDDCEIGLHRRLAQIVQHPDANLSLVTLDYDPTTVDGEMHYVELTRLGDQSIKGILKQAYPGLSDAEVGRVCAFAQGFPRMAVMLGDAALTEEGRVVALHDDVVLKRIVWGREASSPEGQSVLAACSMFDTLGVDGASRANSKSWQRPFAAFHGNNASSGFNGSKGGS